MLVATIETKNEKDWNIKVTINDQLITFKIDTGAQCDVMSSETYRTIGLQPFTKSKARFVAFGGYHLTSLGRAH